MSAEQGDGTPGPGAMSDRMRALLSRAAEEQLLEQRQVSSVLAELRTLVEDVDERLATGAQVERVAEQVGALSARVEARLDAAEARSAELAERIAEATALLGQAAHDLAGVVAAQVAQQVEAQLHDALPSVIDAVAGSEQRLATHVDDAVLALAEVVLRRRSAQGTRAAPAAARLPDVPPPGGFVLVPADVEEPDAGPAPPVQHERRTAERRTSERGDGSGRRRRPWWRPA